MANLLYRQLPTLCRQDTATTEQTQTLTLPLLPTRLPFLATILLLLVLSRQDMATMVETPMAEMQMPMLEVQMPMPEAQVQMLEEQVPLLETSTLMLETLEGMETEETETTAEETETLLPLTLLPFPVMTPLLLLFVQFFLR